MPPSTRKINYAIRSGKHIERRIIFDALLRLDRLRSIEDYTYVGLGGLFFADHLLAHRVLGIHSLISIEEATDKQAKARFGFNKPLGAIKLRHGAASVHLPALTWHDPSIVWLDYDGTIELNAVEDIEQVAGTAAPNSVLICTFNVEPPFATAEGERAADLQKRLGPTLTPLRVRALSNAQLGGWKLGAETRLLVLSAIQRALANRNAALAPPDKMVWTQIFHFQHRDGARMLTLGFICHEASRAAAAANAFSGAPHVNGTATAVAIQAPVLTPKEVLALNAQMPDGLPAESPGVPSTDVKAFSEFYRWYPTFREVEI